MPVARILRETRVADLGLLRGVVLQGTAAEHRLFFPLPRATRLEAGQLDLRFEHDIGISELANLRVTVDGVPRRVDPLRGNGRLDLPLELEPQDLDGDLLEVAVGFSAAHTDDRCFDRRVVPDFAVLRPESALRLIVDAHSVQDLRAAWLLLPRTVTLSIGNAPLDPAAFAGLLELSRRLIESGRQLRFARLPNIPEEAPVGVLASGLAGARNLLFEGHAQDESFAIGHIVVAGAAELAALETAIAAAQDRFQRFSGAAEGELPRPATRLLAQDGSAAPLRLVRFLDYPVIAAGGTDPQATAALLGSDWAALADGPMLDAAAARPEALYPRPANSVSFAGLGFGGGSLTEGESAAWELAFGLHDMPPGRLPTAAELHYTLASPGAAGAGLLHVYLNDVLLRSLRVAGDGNSRRETVALPSYLLGAENRLRVALQRDAGAEEDCGGSPGYPAQLLPTSRILAESETPGPRDFLEFISHIGEAPDFFLPAAALEQPEAVMPLLARLTTALLPLHNRPRLHFLDDGALPPPGRPFVLFGPAAADAPAAPFDLQQGRALLTDRQGRLVLDATAPRSAAVLQLARRGDQHGLWVLPQADGAWPAPATLELRREDVAVIDATGVALALQSDPEAAARVLYPQGDSLLELVEEKRYWLLGGLWLILTLAFLLLLRRFYRRGRRRLHQRRERLQ